MDVRSSRVGQILLVVGMVLIAFNYRTPITSVSPILETIRADLDLTYTTTSLLTTIPTLCFGIFGLTAATVSRRIGRRRAILVAGLFTGLATIVRIWGTAAWLLFLSTVVVGGGIAISQTLLPGVISDYFPDRAGLMTGLYTTSLTIGAGIASWATPQVNDAVASWPISLAIWGIPAIVATMVWLPVALGERRDRGESPSTRRLPWRNPTVWLLTVFFGSTSLLFYGTITWVAPLFVSHGFTVERAGLLLGLFFVGQVVGTLSAAPLSDRHPDRRPWIAATLLLSVVGFGGVILVPDLSAWVWMLLLGVGLGGIYPLCLTLPVDMTDSPAAANRVTAVMVGLGYFISSTGPFLGGIVRDLSGRHELTFVVLGLVTMLLLAATPLFHPDLMIE